MVCCVFLKSMLQQRSERISSLTDLDKNEIYLFIWISLLKVVPTALWVLVFASQRLESNRIVVRNVKYYMPVKKRVHRKQIKEKNFSKPFAIVVIRYLITTMAAWQITVQPKMIRSIPRRKTCDWCSNR